MKLLRAGVGFVRQISGASAREAHRWLALREARIAELEALVRTRESDLRTKDREAERAAAQAAAKFLLLEDRILQLEDQVRRLEDPAATGALAAMAGAEDRALLACESAGGRCSRGKAIWLARLAEIRQLRHALGVGVHGGTALLPMAAAISGWGGATVGAEAGLPGLDPDGAPAGDERDDLAFAAARSRVRSATIRLGLGGSLRLLETSAEQALATLAPERFDLIHLDGSAAPGETLRAIVGWSSLLAEAGVLVVQDLDAPGLADARDHLASRFLTLDEWREEGGASCLAYLRRGDRLVPQRAPR